MSEKSFLNIENPARFVLIDIFYDLLYCLISLNLGANSNMNIGSQAGKNARCDEPKT
jgi:hypothetical protein